MDSLQYFEQYFTLFVWLHIVICLCRFCRKPDNVDPDTTDTPPPDPADVPDGQITRI